MIRLDQFQKYEQTEMVHIVEHFFFGKGINTQEGYMMF